MKVKINNIDEFCEALKAGYLLRSEDVDIQLKENMFYFFAEGLGNVSDPVHIFQYEKPDPLKIECGKQYETRYHRKAFVFKYDENSRKFLVSILNSEHTFMVNEFGRYYDEDIRCELDLISEWKEDK